MFEPRRWNQLAGVVVVAALLGVPPVLGNQYYLQILANIGINTILVLGLNVITGMAGQLSLCQGSFFGVGAYASALLVMRAGLSFWIALPAASLTAGAFGLVLGFPGLRLRGHYLAMLTLGFAVLVRQVLNNWVSLTRGPSGLIGIPWPGAIEFGPISIRVDTRESYYVLIVLFAVAVMAGTRRLMSSRLGVSLMAVREDETAAELMGIDTRLCKLAAFALSAGIAGLAGGLYAHFSKILSPDEFGILESVDILMMLIIGGSGSTAGAVLGAVVLTLLPELLRIFAEMRLVVFGAVLVLVVIFYPNGLMEAVRRVLKPRPDRFAGRLAPPGSAASLCPVPCQARSEAGALLTLDRVTKRFGALVAIGGVSLEVRPREILGLIGPNGSGKTTLLNLISGAYRPNSGEIRVAGQRIGGFRPSDISHAGVSRTFQKIRLFRDLTAIENVAATLAPERPPPVLRRLWTGRLLGTSGNDHADALALLELVGLARRAHDKARNLSYGEQRLLEIARALATRPRLLLLDEPAAGLSAVDVRYLNAVIRRINAAGITILIVEHHMGFLLNIATRVIVLDYGRMIFEGRPADARRDGAVIEAFLGSAAGVR